MHRKQATHTCISFSLATTALSYRARPIRRKAGAARPGTLGIEAVLEGAALLASLQRLLQPPPLRRPVRRRLHPRLRRRPPPPPPPPPGPPPPALSQVAGPARGHPASAPLARWGVTTGPAGTDEEHRASSARWQSEVRMAITGGVGGGSRVHNHVCRMATRDGMAFRGRDGGGGWPHHETARRRGWEEDAAAGGPGR